MKFFVFTLALGLCLTPAFSEEGDRAKVRTFTNKERPSVISDHGGAAATEESDSSRRRPVVDYAPEAPVKKDGHPLGESLVFPEGTRYKVTNW